jgi:hypothetical protein
LLRADLARFELVGGQIVPEWLGPEDHPWLRDLLDRAGASVGRTVRELDQRLGAPLPRSAPPGRVRMASEVVRGLVETEATGARAPEVREAVFLASSVRRRAGDWSRDLALEDAARALGAPVRDVERALLGDLPSERTVRPLDLGPAELALRVNQALANTLLQRATTLEIEAYGNSRDLVRHVRRRGLICVVRRAPDGLRLDISGPFAVFRRTTLYGRAYASILPRLPWCERFALRATCALTGGSGELRLGPGDPIYPAAPPRRFDSKLEEAFARDLAKRHPDWGLVREPEPVEVDGTLVFPDFALYRLAEPHRRWTVEIVGFWTPEYLRTKLERLRQTPGWIVAIDRRLNCSDDDLPPTLGVVRFDRKVPVDEIVALADRLPPEAPTETASLGLRALFVDWAGRKPAADPVHARLATLEAGAEAALALRDGRCFVVDLHGQPLAALSATEGERWAERIDRVRAVRVREVVARTRADSGGPFRGQLKVDRWLVPLLDVVWEAA